MSTNTGKGEQGMKRQAQPMLSETGQARNVPSGHFFIAYSRRDFYFAESLFYALHSRGINAWMDVWKITPGDDWGQAITNAIHYARGLILIATRESLHSQYVKDEICQAYQAHKPIYLVIRGRLSKQDLLISHKYPKGESNEIDLCNYASAIVDMRAAFGAGVTKIADAIFTNRAYREHLPGLFSFKMEQVLYIPAVIAFLALCIVITEIWKFGIGIIYEDQLSQLLSYIRDAMHGAIGGILLLVPMMIWGLIPIGALANIITVSFNFSRRKRVSVSSFVLLLTCAVVTGFSTLVLVDLPAVLLDSFLRGGFPNQGDSFPHINTTLLLLVVFHVILSLLIVILTVVFWLMFRYAKDGRGAILRWLPTGYASAKIRRQGNEAWINSLPDIIVSPGPRYTSYFIVKSAEDSSTAQHIKAILQQKGYSVINDPEKADCHLIILSPFADDGPLKEHEYKVDGRLKPVIYVIARSMKPPKDTPRIIQWIIKRLHIGRLPPKDILSIAIHWIDYRRPTKDQFEKQWERRFSSLKGNDPVFPYVPETLGDSLFPARNEQGIMLTMMAVMVGSVLLISGLEYVILLRKSLTSPLLLISILCVLGAVSLSYYTIIQMIRGAVSASQAYQQWLIIAGALTVIAAFTSQNPLFIFGGLSVMRVFVFLARSAWPRLGSWLPPRSRKSNKKSLLQPISYYKAFTSTTYSRIMIVGLLGLSALITNWWVVPNIPSQVPSQPYAVTVPGPYDLAAPGLWSQDIYADGFGYHFVYHPDRLEISQDQVTGYPTWLKFLGTNSYPMQFTPHFKSSIHIHFTNSEVQTDFGFVLNDFVKMNPNSLLGPQLRLTASGLWMVIESNGDHYSGQIAKKELAHDYTLEVEVNGILCTFTIDGKEVTAITDTTLSSVQDIMFSFANLASSTTTYDLSNFTYTPIPGPALSREEAIKLVAALNSAPYTTAAPGWNCNPNDGRWNAGYEPVHQTTALTCTRTGTRLNTSAKEGVLLNFDNNRFGELPDAFDYSFDATFQDTNVPCIAMLTYASVTTTGIAYAYTFVICSDGTWATRYLGYHTENLSVFLNKRLKSGHINIKRTMAIFVKFRSTIQKFYINKQLITSYEASNLKPTILFGNGQGAGAVMYSNFSYVPITQQ